MPTTAKLSCHHKVTVEHSPGVTVGSKVRCPRCKAKADGSQPERTIKLMDAAPTQADNTVLPTVEAEPVVADVETGEPLDRDEHGVYTDRHARRLAATGEAADLKNWQNAGEPGPRPVTPNLDALEAQAKDRKPNGTPVVRKGRKASQPAERAERIPRSELAAEARRVMKQLDGKRGKGSKLTPEELVRYIADMRAQHPAEGRSAVMEYAYWVHKLAFSRATWNAAWEQASKSA